MCDEMETVKGFCLGDRLNANRGCEAAVIARTRVWRDTVWKKILFADERKGI